MGFTIIGFALLLLVQSHNVYPQLLIARLFFSLGGSATSTMVTAILPSMLYSPISTETERPSRDFEQVNNSTTSLSAQRMHNVASLLSQSVKQVNKSSSNRLAGLVGFFTGCGALLALGLFLPLPALFQQYHFRPESALANSFYVVAATSFGVSIFCLFGLRNLRSEEGKSWRSLVFARNPSPELYAGERISSLRSLLESIKICYGHPDIGLTYIGGFVARASSVGISLFIPLFINSYYIQSGLCSDSSRDLQNLQGECREAYILAAKLTGISQLVALLFAPIFGYVAGKFSRFNAALSFASLMGLLGYIALSTLKSPKPDGKSGNPWVFLIMAMLGISQIGAIVCSLGLLGHCVMGLEKSTESRRGSMPHVGANGDDVYSQSDLSFIPKRPVTPDQADGHTESNEEAHLLLKDQRFTNRPYRKLKGSIAGIYSFAGGAGILLLTKIGGVMFDRVSPVAPFYMLALFNALLLVVSVIRGISDFRVASNQPY